MNHIIHPVILSIFFFSPVTKAITPKAAVSGIAFLTSVPNLLLSVVHIAEYANIQAFVKYAEPEHRPGLIEASKMEIANTVLSVGSAGAAMSLCAEAVLSDNETRGLGTRLALVSTFSAAFPLSVTIMSGIVASRLNQTGAIYLTQMAVLETAWAGLSTVALGVAAVTALTIPCHLRRVATGGAMS